MREKIEIREMEIDDLAPVFHLGEQLFTNRKVPNLYRTWDEYEVISLFAEGDGLCLVAEHEGRVIGFALGTTISKNRSTWKYGYLIWLGVAAGHQRAGLATRLFGQLRQLMIEDGVGLMLVDTQADNQPALRFFESVGFGHSEEHVYLSANLRSFARKRGRTSS